MAKDTFAPLSDKQPITLGISDVASRAADKASELGWRAVNAVDAQRESAASGLESVATELHAGADTLGASADYLRQHRVGDMWDDIQGYAKSHPAQALVGAVAVGFLAGWVLRRS